MGRPASRGRPGGGASSWGASYGATVRSIAAPQNEHRDTLLAVLLLFVPRGEQPFTGHLVLPAAPALHPVLAARIEGGYVGTPAHDHVHPSLHALPEPRPVDFMDDTTDHVHRGDVQEVAPARALQPQGLHNGPSLGGG